MSENPTNNTSSGTTATSTATAATDEFNSSDFLKIDVLSNVQTVNSTSLMDELLAVESFQVEAHDSDNDIYADDSNSNNNNNHNNNMNHKPITVKEDNTRNNTDYGTKIMNDDHNMFSDNSYSPTKSVKPITEISNISQHKIVVPVEETSTPSSIIDLTQYESPNVPKFNPSNLHNNHSQSSLQSLQGSRISSRIARKKEKRAILAAVESEYNSNHNLSINNHSDTNIEGSKINQLSNIPEAQDNKRRFVAVKSSIPHFARKLLPYKRPRYSNNDSDADYHTDADMSSGNSSIGSNHNNYDPKKQSTKSRVASNPKVLKPLSFRPITKAALLEAVSNSKMNTQCANKVPSDPHRLSNESIWKILKEYIDQADRAQQLAHDAETKATSNKYHQKAVKCYSQAIYYWNQFRSPNYIEESAEEAEKSDIDIAHSCITKGLESISQIDIANKSQLNVHYFTDIVIDPHLRIHCHRNNCNVVRTIHEGTYKSTKAISCSLWQTSSSASSEWDEKRYCDILRGRSYSLWCLDRNDEAIADLEIAATYFPCHSGIYYELAKIYHDISRSAKDINLDYAEYFIKVAISFLNFDHQKLEYWNKLADIYLTGLRMDEHCSLVRNGVFTSLINSVSSNNKSKILYSTMLREAHKHVAEAYQTEGHRHINKKEDQKAITKYNAALQHYKSHPETIFHRGEAYQNLHDFTTAIADFNTFLQLDKKRRQQVLNANSNNNIYNNDDEVTDLEEFTESEFNLHNTQENRVEQVCPYRAYLNIGECYWDMVKLCSRQLQTADDSDKKEKLSKEKHLYAKKAQEAFELAVKLNPESALACGYLGEIYCEYHVEYEESITRCNKAIALANKFYEQFQRKEVVKAVDYEYSPIARRILYNIRGVCYQRKAHYHPDNDISLITNNNSSTTSSSSSESKSEPSEISIFFNNALSDFQTCTRIKMDNRWDDNLDDYYYNTAETYYKRAISRYPKPNDLETALAIIETRLRKHPMNNNKDNNNKARKTKKQQKTTGPVTMYSEDTLNLKKKIFKELGRTEELEPVEMNNYVINDNSLNLNQRSEFEPDWLSETEVVTSIDIESKYNSNSKKDQNNNETTTTTSSSSPNYPNSSSNISGRKRTRGTFEAAYAALQKETTNNYIQNNNNNNTGSRNTANNILHSNNSDDVIMEERKEDKSLQFRSYETVDIRMNPEEFSSLSDWPWNTNKCIKYMTWLGFSELNEEIARTHLDGEDLIEVDIEVWKGEILKLAEKQGKKIEPLALERLRIKLTKLKESIERNNRLEDRNKLGKSKAV